jgi:hypothetical protein
VSTSNRSSELRLPTKVVAARLALVGGVPIDAELFVADVRRRGRGHLLDDIATQLGGESTFIPMRWDNQVRLLAKHSITWIAIRRRDPDEMPSRDFDNEPSELTLYDREHRVEIELAHGGKLIGTILDSSPADRPRVMDHLNRTGRFVRLWTSDEHFLINATQVVTVIELADAGAR